MLLSASFPTFGAALPPAYTTGVSPHDFLLPGVILSHNAPIAVRHEVVQTCMDVSAHRAVLDLNPSRAMR